MKSNDPPAESKVERIDVGEELQDLVDRLRCCPLKALSDELDALLPMSTGAEAHTE